MKEQEMAAKQQKEQQERLESEKKTLAGLVSELPALALALAKTYETRRPHAQRRGRLHAV
jgi:hypothetical protein